MEARASSVVQLGGSGLLEVVHPTLVEEPGELAVQLTFHVRQDGVDESLAACGIDQDVPSVWATS